MANRDKHQVWSKTIQSSACDMNPLPANMSDLASRVSLTENVNKQILNDLNQLRQELQIVRGRFAVDRPAKSLHSDYDSDASLVQAPHQRRSQLRPVKQLASVNLPDRANSEKSLQRLSNDVQTVNLRYGSQALDIQNLRQEMRTLGSKLENALHNDSLRLQTEVSPNPRSSRDSSCGGVSIQRLEATVGQMMAKLEQIQNDRLKFENTIHYCLLDQTTRSSEFEKMTKDTMDSLQSMLKDNSQEIISIRQNISLEMEKLSSKHNQRIESTVEKMQDGLIDFNKNVQATLDRFRLVTSDHETRLLEAEKGIKNMLKDLPNELDEIRDDQQINASITPQKVHQKKLLNSLAQLDSAVEVLEKGLLDEKKQLKEVVAAEIKARTTNICAMQSKLGDLEESFKGMIMRLDSSVGEIQERLNLRTKNETNGRMTPNEDANVSKKLEDLDKELANLQADSERNSEDMGTNLKNIAMSIRAVKKGLLAKIEKSEAETQNAIQELMSEINAIKGKPD